MASISAECPICFERYSGPIFICERGHSICSQCTSQVTQCPTCRAPMTTARNFTLEAILAESAHSSTSRNFECPFKECRKPFQSQNGLKSHEKDCEFRDVICGLCDSSIPYGDFIYHLIQVHKVQEKSTDRHIPINIDKIKSEDGDGYILYNQNGENLLVEMMVQDGLFYIWIEHLKRNANSSGIEGNYKIKFWKDGQTKVLLLVCPILDFRGCSKQDILEHQSLFNLKQLENFRGTGTPITSIMISSNGANNQELPTNESVPELNLSDIEINDTEFKLDQDNFEILSSLKQNTTVKRLECKDISVKKLKEILKIFNGIEELRFWHEWDSAGKCKYLNSSSEVGDCIFKMPQMNRYENLNKLLISNLEINTGDVHIGTENLPALKILIIYRCNIRGNLVDTILTRLFALEEIQLFGNTPLLEKKDVEILLRIRSLKKLYLNKFPGPQVISGSFTPIGPDGKPFGKITQNAEIHFDRDLNNLPWKMTMTPKE